jgi:hypothetical protein
MASGLRRCARPARIAGVLWLVQAATVSAYGQSLPDDTAPQDELQANQTVLDRFEEREINTGTKIGDFLISPELNFGFGHDDNLFGQTSPNRQGDWFATYGGNVAVRYAYDTWKATWDTDYSQRRYIDFTSDDYWTGSSHLTLSNQISPTVALLADGGVERDIIPPGSPLALNGLGPSDYWVYDGELGTQLGDPQENFATLYVGVDQTRYGDLPTAAGSFSQTDQNRFEVYGDARLTHVFFGQQQVFLEVRPDQRSYQIDPDTSGFRRDNSGVRTDIGFTFNPDDLWKVTFTTGYQENNYDDSRFGSIGEPDVKLDALWTPSLLTSVELKFTHEYVEEILEQVGAETPGYVHNEEEIGVQHEFRRNIIGSIDVSYDAQNFVHSTLHYDVVSPSAEIQYLFADGLSLKFDYNYTSQNQNLPNQYSYRNVFTVNFVKRF